MEEKQNKNYLGRWLPRFQVILGVIGVFISAFGVAVTLIIAIFAHNLEEKFQNQENYKSKVMLSTALFQGYNNSTFFEQLRKTLNDYEHRVQRIKSHGKPENQSGRRALMTVFEQESRQNLNDTKNNVKELLKMSEILYYCIYPNNNQNEKMKCDEEMIVNLFGNTFSEFFYYFGPVMFCDAEMKKYYESYAEKFQKLVRLYYENKGNYNILENQRQYDRFNKLFRNYTNEEYKSGFIILRIPSKYCVIYPISNV